MRARKSYALCLMAVLVVFGCGKSDSTSGRGARGSKPDAETEPSSGRGAHQPPAEVQIDGAVGEWTHTRPLWEEAGNPGRGTTPRGIDVKQVYVSNDKTYLYIAMRCQPTVQKRFQKYPRMGGVCDFYFDVDNDRKTGSADVKATTYDTFLDGFEFKAWIVLGVSATNQPFVHYELRRFAGGDFSNLVRGAKHDSLPGDGAEWLAHGADGVELKIPLKHLGAVPGQAIRILAAESAHQFEPEGYSERVFTLSK